MTSLSWARAGAAFDGADESGDLHVVEPLAHGWLLAVIDGLGHGADAAAAAAAAAGLVRAHAGEPVRAVFESCHEGLRGTRGVVMSLAVLDVAASRVQWFGVGNVEAWLFHGQPDGSCRKDAVNSRGGVLGYRLPPINVGSAPLHPGDLLVLATDGVDSGFSREVPLDWEPQLIADWLLMRYRKSTDDALALVARYLGSARP